MEFFEATADAFAHLYWSSPSTSYAIVPQDHLYPPDSPGKAPVLSWTGEANYTSDGLNPQAGDEATLFTYRVKYTDEDGDAPIDGYPRVHILKEGQKISGSPFAMDFMSGNDTDGAIYSYSITLPEGTEYSYYFDAVDTTGLQAVAAPSPPTPAVPFNSPNVSSAPPQQGDLDGSGRVDGFDLGIVGMAIGSQPGDPHWNPDADLNQDGSVGNSDLNILLANFGKTI